MADRDDAQPRESKRPDIYALIQAAREADRDAREADQRNIAAHEAIDRALRGAGLDLDGPAYVQPLA